MTVAELEAWITSARYLSEQSGQTIDGYEVVVECSDRQSPLVDAKVDHGLDTLTLAGH